MSKKVFMFQSFLPIYYNISVLETLLINNLKIVARPVSKKTDIFLSKNILKSMSKWLELGICPLDISACSQLMSSPLIMENYFLVFLQTLLSPQTHVPLLDFKNIIQLIIQTYLCTPLRIK